MNHLENKIKLLQTHYQDILLEAEREKFSNDNELGKIKND